MLPQQWRLVVSNPNLHWSNLLKAMILSYSLCLARETWWLACWWWSSSPTTSSATSTGSMRMTSGFPRLWFVWVPHWLIILDLINLGSWKRNLIPHWARFVLLLLQAAAQRSQLVVWTGAASDGQPDWVHWHHQHLAEVQNLLLILPSGCCFIQVQYLPRGGAGSTLQYLQLPP